MPRFVILTHDHPFPHWDLMLEAGWVLRTWRLLRLPEAGVAVPAEPLGDHRVHYLDHEGPVSENRGTVKRWDSGTYDLLSENADRLCFQLRGRHVRGESCLRKNSDNCWELVIQAKPEV